MVGFTCSRHAMCIVQGRYVSTSDLTATTGHVGSSGLVVGLCPFRMAAWTPTLVPGFLQSVQNL
jgi:hypothetical protein